MTFKKSSTTSKNSKIKKKVTIKQDTNAVTIKKVTIKKSNLLKKKRFKKVTIKKITFQKK